MNKLSLALLITLSLHPLMAMESHQKQPAYQAEKKDNRWAELMHYASNGTWKETHIQEWIHDRVNIPKIGGVTMLLEAARNGHLNAIEGLIKQGAHVNLPDNTGWTPLLQAAYTGNKAMAQCLIEHDADIHYSLKNKNWTKEWTALTTAADVSHPTKNHIACCEIFIEKMLDGTIEQKNQIYTFLNCLKQINPTHYTNLRNVFQNMLYRIIRITYEKPISEINKIRNTYIKQQLLTKYFPKSSNN